MLSDEEKEALRNFKSEYESCDHYSSDLIIELDDAEILLNLIEKQSKEIEELKENNKNFEDELNKYIVKMSDEQYRRLVDIIRDEINKFWKYKIKAKIEELEKEITEDKKKNDGFWSDYSIYLDAQREGFQSLLEKE